MDIYGKTDNKEQSIQVLKDLVRIDPENIKIRFRLAAALEEKGAFDQAIPEYETLAAKTEEEDKLPIYKSLGYLYTETDRWEKAISYYLKAAELDQKDPNIYYNLSYLCEKISDQENADFYLENAITIKADDLDGKLKLARSLFERGEDEKAAGYISDVLKKDGNNLEALSLMASLLERTGDKMALKSVYAKRLSLQEDNQTIIYNLGALEYETGNLEKSLFYFNKYITLEPGDGAAHNILFDIYKRQNNTDMALEQALIIQAINPGDMDVYHYIFSNLKETPDFEKAIPLFKQGLESDTDHADIKYYLITSYLRTDKENLAIAEMEQLLQTEPEDISPLLAGYVRSTKQKRTLSRYHPDHGKGFKHLPQKKSPSKNISPLLT